MTMHRTLAKLALGAAALLLLADAAAADKLDDVKARGRLIVGVSEIVAAVQLSRRRQRRGWL